MKQRKLRIGDIVKVTESGYGFAPSCLGKKYKIIEISKRGYGLDVGAKVIDFNGNIYKNPHFDDWVGLRSLKLVEYKYNKIYRYV